MASSFDEGTDGSGWILPAGVIQCQSDERGCPVFKDAHEPAGRDVITNIRFHNIPKTNALLSCYSNKARFVESYRTLNVDLDRVSTRNANTQDRAAVARRVREAAKNLTRWCLRNSGAIHVASSFLPSR